MGDDRSAVNAPEWAEWSSELSDRLRSLWDEGYTCRVIAGMLGVTRNAVIGRARRMKLAYRKNPGRKKGRGWSQAAKDRQMRARMLRKAFGEQPQLQADRAPPKADVWRALPGTTPVPLHELTGCKWPIGDDRPYLFCNAETQGRYCPQHSVFSTGESAANSAAAFDLDSRNVDNASGDDERFVLANKPVATLEAPRALQGSGNVNTSVRTAA